MLLCKRLLGLLLVLSCGGSSGPVKEPSALRTHESRDSVSEREPEQAAPRKERSAPRCEDGSCFSCGDVICLAGYYCLASKSGRGCAWIPSCAGSVACGCVMEALRENGSCRCEEKDAGVFVACDGAKL